MRHDVLLPLMVKYIIQYSIPQVLGARGDELRQEASRVTLPYDLIASYRTSNRHKNVSPFILFLGLRSVSLAASVRHARCLTLIQEASA